MTYSTWYDDPDTLDPRPPRERPTARPLCRARCGNTVPHPGLFCDECMEIQ